MEYYIAHGREIAYNLIVEGLESADSAEIRTSLFLDNADLYETMAKTLESTEVSRMYTEIASTLRKWVEETKE